MLWKESGKRLSGGAIVGSCHFRGKLLIQKFYIDGVSLQGLIDTGCSVTLIKASSATSKPFQLNNLRLDTMGGGSVISRKSVELKSVKTEDCQELGPVNAHVVEYLPLNLDLVIGFDLISRIGLVVGPRNGHCAVKVGDIKQDTNGCVKPKMQN